MPLLQPAPHLLTALLVLWPSTHARLAVVLPAGRHVLERGPEGF
jgi:hypothetical protein